MAILALTFTIYFTAPTFAEHLLKEEDYFNAITEYKRLLYKGTIDSSRAFARIAWAYEQRHRLRDALEYWGRVNVRVPSPLIRTKMAALWIQLGDHAPLRYLLLQSDTTRPYMLLRSIYRYVEFRDSSAAHVLDSLGIPRPWLPSRRWVSLTSLFLPGIPQMLLGRPLEGMLAFFATTGSLYWAYRLYREGNTVDALLVGTTLFFRFYTGAWVNALKAWKRRKSEILQIAVQEIEGSLTKRLRSLQLLP